MALLRLAWARWKGFAHWLGDKQATLVYTVLYIVVVGPLAVVRQSLSDPLQFRARGKATYWLPRPPAPATLAEARRQ